MTRLLCISDLRCQQLRCMRGSKICRISSLRRLVMSLSARVQEGRIVSSANEQRRCLFCRNSVNTSGECRRFHYSRYNIYKCGHQI